MSKNNYLVQARRNLKYTQQQLAGLMGCTKATISNWENGYSNPSLEDAFKLAEILQCDINSLFFEMKFMIRNGEA